LALRVFFDGSGKSDDHPTITVGGFLGDDDLCKEIEHEWNAATKNRVFHFSDFGKPRCNLGSHTWSAIERTAFLKKLASIINREGSYIFTASLEIAAFNEILYKAAHPQELGPSFSACAYGAILNTEALLLKEGRQHREVHYAFEKGDREHEIKKIFADWNSKNSEYKGLRSHTFLPKNTTLLQPADLVAGIVQRCVVSAFNAFPSLDNGLARTRLQTFDRHYSGDGVTATIVSGHDHDKCWIVNPKSFDFLDQIGSRFFERHPDQLKKRMKQSPYKPKSAEKPTV
jgi:hypothetical protein